MDATRKPPVKIRDEVLAVPPYRQGAAPTKPGFKLSSNENPFAPMPRVEDAVHSAAVNRYASPAMPELRADIGRLFDLDVRESVERVHLGAGSVSILFQLIHAVAGPGDEVVYAWPSFEAYPLLGIASGATSVPVDLTANAEHDLEAMAHAVTHRTRAVILCTPNNPTGPIIRAADFEQFMARVPADVLVILDEAYAEFVTATDAVRGGDVLNSYDNLVVLRTFSKAYGLASLRIGYGVGHPEVWNAARTVGIPLSVTAQAEAAALASLEAESQATLKTQIQDLVARREALVAGLRELGLYVPDAQANFVWLPIGDLSVPLGEAFAEEGTLVRPFAGEGVRISVGEEASIPEVLRVLADFIERYPEVRSALRAQGGVA